MAAALTRRPLASLLYRAISSQSDRLPLPLINSTADATTYPPQQPNPIIIAARFKTTGPGYSPLSDPSLTWSNRPPKDPILPHGFDYEHWLILMEFNPKPTEKEMINAYVKTLATVVGSEKEAKKKIYKVCTITYTGFGARISKELSNKVKGLPGVLWVLPDSYLDVANKDYGGYLFKNGKVIRRHEHRFIGRQITGNRPRPRYDRL